MSAIGPRQMGLDLGGGAALSYAPEVADVRVELLDILATIRTADGGSPWDERTLRYHRTVFPQMARWLPNDERDRLCFEFAREADRIEMLLAA